jgi:hypothetical protein
MPLGWGSRVGKASSHRAWPEYVCVASAMALLAIWVLPDTIALRHLLLLTGALSAAVVIYRSAFLYHRRFVELMPLAALATLFVWVIIHYLAFSLNPALEASEIQSLWMRCLLAALMGIGVRISIATQPTLQPYFFVALWIVPLINLGAYIYVSWKAGHFLLPNEFVTAFTFKKIEAAFYGVLAVSIACANLIYWFGMNHPQKKMIVTAWTLAIAIAMASAIAASTKNGVAGIFGLCALLVLIFIFQPLIHRQKSTARWKRTLTGGIIILLLIAVWQVHLRFASHGWGTLIDDIQISARVHEHDYWRKNNPTVFPNNSSGRPVAGNTYERVAWATVGLGLIKDYPLGYGSVNRSFKGMLDHAKIEHALQSQTHSGWIDFGLAYGVPGLAIFAITFLSIFVLAIRNINQYSLMGLWLVIGIVPFGLIAEVTYKHNFETLIFFIALASAFVVSAKPQNKYA